MSYLDDYCETDRGFVSEGLARALTLVRPCIREFDFSAVSTQLRSDYRWDEDEIEVTELHFKLLLQLASCFRDELVVPYVGLDTFWSTAVLHTRLYAKLCCTCFGGAILHHHINSHDPLLRGFVCRQFLVTRDLCFSLFEYAPEAYQRWANVGHCCGCFDGSVASKPSPRWSSSAGEWGRVYDGDGVKRDRTKKENHV